MRSALCAVGLCLCLWLSVCAGSATINAVTDIPGVDPSEYTFSMYSGYVGVGDASLGHRLFFYIVESQRDPANDPVIVKIGGGPGCSAVGEGFFEVGPFVAEPDGESLRVNQWSYNTVANLIYLDSPCGTGFSKPTIAGNIVTSDSVATSEAFDFLTQFFSVLRPDWITNPLWLIGGSYCGHYLPQLANYILEHNGENGTKLNFAGFTLGNPLTDLAYDQFAQIDTLYTHTIISSQTYNSAVANCDFSIEGLLVPPPLKSKCTAALLSIMTEMGNIDSYELYGNPCTDNETIWAKPQPYYQPCIDSFVEAYMNRADVQKAFNIDGTVVFSQCNMDTFTFWNADDFARSMLPLWATLPESGINILVYGGDVDDVIPTSGTRAWVDGLALPEVSSWKPWLVEGLVSGYSHHYQGLTFATVKNAGHMVAYCQPKTTFHMWSNFIAGQF
ncbi:Serine carboxypeptidase 2 [Pelomyxa schiedti]|nr:Serine carboxypeptidase 2 [Pelomyxa schiedti]